MRGIIVLIVSLTALNAFAQTKMRKVEELINTADPGWPFVQQWLDSARNKVEILPVDTVQSRNVLLQTQVTTRSPMGAIIYKTGGILVDGGWIRILGSGHPRLNRTLPDWNKGKSFKKCGETPSYLLVADDAMGGFFAINGGAFGKEMGKVYYFAPDNLEWEEVNDTYTEFLLFCFNGDLDKFYEGYRWKGWQQEVAALPGDKVYSFYPYLYTIDGKNINNSTKSVIPVAEQFDFNLNMRRQLGFDTNYHK